MSKWLLAILLLCAVGARAQAIPFPGPGMPASSGGSVATLIQSHVGSSGLGTTTCIVTTSSTAAGHLLIGYIDSYGSHGQNTPSLVDTNLDTFTADFDAVGTVGRQTVFRLANSTSGNLTFTFTILGGTGATSSCAVLEFSGVLTTSPLDVAVSANNVQASTTSWTSNAITTTVQDLLLGFTFSSANDGLGFTSTGAWATGLDIPNATDHGEAFGQWQLSAASGSGKVATGTVTSTTTNTIIVSYKLL